MFFDGKIVETYVTALNLIIQKPLLSYYLMAMELDLSFHILTTSQMKETIGQFALEFHVEQIYGRQGTLTSKMGIQNEADIRKKSLMEQKLKLYMECKIEKHDTVGLVHHRINHSKELKATSEQHKNEVGIL